MPITRMLLAELNPAAYNPRERLQPGDPDYEGIKASLVEFGQVEPLVWNSRTGNLVGGHQRLCILSDLGETEADVSVVDLCLEDEQRLSLALNNLKGRWDQAKLADLLADLHRQPLNLTVTGFSRDQLAHFLQQSRTQHAADFLSPVLSPVPPAADRVSSPRSVPPPVAPLAASPSGEPPAASPSYAQLTFAVTPDQRQQIQAALRHAKKYWQLATSQEALAAICAEFLAGKETA